MKLLHAKRVLASMSHAAETESRRPLTADLPILEAVDAEPLDVVAAEPMEVVAANEALEVIEELPDAEAPFAIAVEPAPLRSLPVRIVWGIGSVLAWLFGALSLMIGLAVLSALPILQFLSLGYLLEAGGRIARTGRLRDGFIGVRLAGRLGGIVLCSWLFLLPVRYVSDMVQSAQIIDPGSRTAANWRIGLVVLIAATFLHIALAIARGGKKRYFLWPFNFIWLIRRVLRGGYYTEARDAVWDTTMSLRLPYYLWLGFRGFVCAFAWLALPISLLAISSRGHSGGASLLGFIGAFLLAIVLLYLPFLQLRMAAENRLRAGFQLLAARREFARAPWAFAFSFIVTLAFALPLYLLKIQVVPKEAAWVPSFVFIVFIFPARLFTGWALGRARGREAPRHWFFRWTARVPLLPVAAFYVLIVFFTQYTSWNGIWSLYEQHAFLVPVPFFGM